MLHRSLRIGQRVLNSAGNLRTRLYKTQNTSLHLQVLTLPAHDRGIVSSIPMLEIIRSFRPVDSVMWFLNKNNDQTSDNHNQQSSSNKGDDQNPRASALERYKSLHNDNKSFVLNRYKALGGFDDSIDKMNIISNDEDMTELLSAAADKVSADQRVKVKSLVDYFVKDVSKCLSNLTIADYESLYETKQQISHLRNSLISTLQTVVGIDDASINELKPDIDKILLSSLGLNLERLIPTIEQVLGIDVRVLPVQIDNVNFGDLADKVMKGDLDTISGPFKLLESRKRLLETKDFSLHERLDAIEQYFIFSHNVLSVLADVDPSRHQKELIDAVLKIDQVRRQSFIENLVNGEDGVASFGFVKTFSLIRELFEMREDGKRVGEENDFQVVMIQQEELMRNLVTRGFSSNPRPYQEEKQNLGSAKSTSGRKTQKPKVVEKEDFADLGKLLKEQRRKFEESLSTTQTKKQQPSNINDILNALDKVSDSKITTKENRSASKDAKKVNEEKLEEVEKAEIAKLLNEILKSEKDQKVDELDNEKSSLDANKTRPGVRKTRRSQIKDLESVIRKLSKATKNDKFRVKIKIDVVDPKDDKNEGQANDGKENDAKKKKKSNSFMFNEDYDNKFNDQGEKPADGKSSVNKILMNRIMIFAAIYLVYILFSLKSAVVELTEAEFEGAIKLGTVKNVEIRRDRNAGFVVTFNNGSNTVCNYRIDDVHKFLKWVEVLQAAQGYTEKDFIKINLGNLENNKSNRDISSYIFALALVALFLFLKNEIGRGLKQMAKPMKSNEHKKKVDITFKDVAGMAEVKEEMYEFVEFLKNPEKFKKLGAKMPRGALLTGPPGTGKTYLAKAVAGESGIPFFYMSGSEFVEMFVGVGASRVRDLFKEARKKSPSIIFIDEIDAVAKRRDTGLSHDEMESTLNQLLVEMDGFGTDTNVVVMAATNLKDALDPAILRPGRFDRIIEVSLPTIQEREEIFTIYLNKLKLNPERPIEFYAKRLATLTPGFSPADISNICNEAALLAARADADSVNEIHFERATEKVIAGIEVKSASFEEQKETIAIHECGHGVVSWFLPGGSPLLKLVIKPRSKGALGFAQYLPSETSIYTKEELLDQIAGILGGRCAEMVFFGESSTGAYDDLQKAQKIAFDLVTTYGMSDTMKYIRFDYDEYGNKKFSENTHSLIDKEVSRIIDEQTQRCLTMITDKKDIIRKLADKLLEKEILVFNDIVDILGDRPFDPHENFRRFLEESNKMRLKPEVAEAIAN